MIKAAYVNIWNKRVGAVAWNEEEGIATFRYDPEFLETGLDLSPVMMPLNESLNYRFPEHRNTTTFKGLPGMLADVLPDKYEMHNKSMASETKQATNSINPIETLCFIGKRAMGALEFEPSEPKITGHSIKLEMNELIDITSKDTPGRQAFSNQSPAGSGKSLTSNSKKSERLPVEHEQRH